MKTDLKRKVWIIQPLPHGNGGWYGQKILSSKRGMQLKRALTIKNPYSKYNVYLDENCWSDAAIRICYKLDVNKSLYYFNYDEYKWKKL